MSSRLPLPTVHTNVTDITVAVEIDRVRVSNVAFFGDKCPACKHGFDYHSKEGCHYDECSCDIVVQEAL